MMYSFGIRHRQPWLVLSAQPDADAVRNSITSRG